MAPRFEPGFGYYNEYPGRREAEDGGEDVSDEGEDSDEEAAALARIRDRSSSRRGTEKRSSVGGLGREALGATAAKRQKAVEPVAEADNWVCCDRCNKWRLLRKDVFDRTVREDEQWFCEYNYGRYVTVAVGTRNSHRVLGATMLLGRHPSYPIGHGTSMRLWDSNTGSLTKSHDFGFQTRSQLC